MSENEHEVPTALEMTDPPEQRSLLDQLAEKRQVVADTRETMIQVPGYDKEPPILLIKYRLLEGKDLAKIAGNVRSEFRNRWEQGLHAAVDTFVAAIAGVYIDPGDGAPPVPLTYQGEPITGFTRELAEGLKFDDKIADPDRPRDVVFGLFGGNDVALSAHSFQLNRWFGNTSLDVSRDMFEGNL